MRRAGLRLFVTAVLTTALGALAFERSATALARDKVDARETAAFQALERHFRDAANRAASPTAAVPFRIDAELPKLHKRGVLRGLRVITGAGRVAYTRLSFVGDSLIKTAVIARFLSAETKVKADAEAAEIAPRNYRFLYKRTADYDGRTAFVFTTEPKQRRAGLFKGELWIDTETARPLREWGEFVKSPSAFLRHVNFVRDYASSSTDPSVRRIVVRMRAAFAGPVELTMWFDEPDASESSEN